MGCLTCGAARARRLRAGRASVAVPRLRPKAIAKPVTKVESLPEEPKPVSGEVPATPKEPEPK